MSTRQAKSLIADYGAIAQLVEHLHGMQGVSGSNPLGSTTFSLSGNPQVEQKLEQGC